MRITGTVKNFKTVIILLVFIFLAGCNQRPLAQQAKDYAKQSEVQYERAVSLYKDLIKKGKDLDRLYFQLGQLYYNHGDFTQAIAQLRNVQGEPPKKFLAISYYRLGNFTDALGVFDKKEDTDDEGLYYYGLTCEKLNLFDQALEIYKKIKTKEWASLSAGRSNIIERQVDAYDIRNISPETADIISRAPSEELYPQAGALILSCDEKIEIKPDNSQISTLRYIVKILNERGKENFSESHIEYDSTYEKVELEYARTIRPDGTVFEVGSRHIRDVSRYLNFPLYSNARIFIISFPEITEGAVVEYKVRIYRSRLINKKDFVFSYPLQAQEPIIAASFSITLPQERNLNIKNLNGRYDGFGADLKPSVQKKDKELIYSWQFKDIPQIVPESNMPPEVEINPTMLMSTFSSWREIYDWWWQLARDKIKADAAIKEKVKGLIAPARSEEERARAIYNFCAQKIRYVAVEYGQAGYEPHKAEDIFRNKYGDCKDQAILLVTMLKEAGLTAWPVLIPTKEYYNLAEDFPAVLFNHCIAAVSLKEKIIFLDPTAETCSFGDLPVDDQGRKVLLFGDFGYKIYDIPASLASHNLISQRFKIQVNSDETIAAEKTILTRGMYDQAQRYWLLYTPPELIEETLKEKIQDVSIGARLKGYDIKNQEDLNKPITLHYTFLGPEYFTPAGALRIMPQLVSLDTSLVAKDQRKYSIDFALLDIKETMFEIEIPDDFVVNYMPENITADSPWLTCKIEYSRKDKYIIFVQKTELKKSLVLKEDYPVFKDFFEGLAKKIKQRIILEKRTLQ
jgi:tetratricopeptide (TPR) repeat protein